MRSPYLTSGPWHVFTIIAIGGVTYDVRGGPYQPNPDTFKTRVASVGNEADAHAIAAVPEMLRALEIAHSFLAFHKNCEDVQTAVADAIKLARNLYQKETV